AVAGLKVKLFAEDGVGNASSRSFFNKTMPRRWREVTLELKEGFLREQVGILAERNLAKLQAQALEAGEKLEHVTPINSPQRLVEDFQLVNDRLRRLDDIQIQSLLMSKRSSRVWEGPFLMQNGIVELAYGSMLVYRFAGETIGRSFQQGYEMRPVREDRGVVAANKGVVVFSENFGVYGRSIGIDHGFGLATIYGQLERVLVDVGDAVESGQMIGHAGRSGLARGPNVYFEMRVQGVPVDAREWWDKPWFFAHILGKIDEVKKVLGLQNYR
ncbi:MAG: M23 family metallopeptidase, partial [Deltaproteobacteria bacterium]|nr:M23 family metallopeptidase [Deltaproteobacteria bacterium]